MDRLLVVIFGLMGVGKTTVARALAQAREWPALHSDTVRKVLAGLGPTTPARFEFGQGIYNEDFSRRTYEEMRRLAAELLDKGAQGVILDASFKSAAERARVRELAQEKGARAVFVYCYCPQEVVQERLHQRADNTRAISDGRSELLDLQMQDFDPLTEADQPLLKLDTGRELAEVRQEISGFLDEFLPNSHDGKL
jgi:predicted kinase